MAQSFKICPICGTHTHSNATICATCGTSLAEVSVISSGAKKIIPNAYDRHYGEADLLEGDLKRNRGIYFATVAILAPILLCLGFFVFQGVNSFSGLIPTEVPPTSTITPVPTSGGVPSIDSGTPPAPALDLATNTPLVPPILATVTDSPPTATMTPTQGPCEVRVQAGEDLITLAWRCGHRTLDVMPEILELNNMRSAEALQVGQVLFIPWPTPTLDPNAPANNTGASSETGEQLSSNGIAVASNITEPTESRLYQPTATNTLIPGVTWYQVIRNDSIVSIAYGHFTTVEVLEDLNPEITFSQCDYSSDYGGPRCTVFLSEGQLVRVPVPSPTPTLSPTPNGSETPTPSATATFNVPSPLRPTNGALFFRNDLVTLRWVGTGNLGPNEAYYIAVKDLTANTTYADTTTQLSFVVPTQWQGADTRRHDYEWTVSIIQVNDPSATPTHTTETRTFTWEARGESN